VNDDPDREQKVPLRHNGTQGRGAFTKKGLREKEGKVGEATSERAVNQRKGGKKYERDSKKNGEIGNSKRKTPPKKRKYHAERKATKKAVHRPESLRKHNF